jgi:glycosyltransferase involved in cell wall biosynthesis
MVKGVTVCIPTCNRYDSLHSTLQSVVLQSIMPHEVIIFDDTPEHKDLREMPAYQYLFRLMEYKGIKWRVVFGEKKGQHYSHQKCQQIAETEFIWRIDDDEVAEYNCMEELLKVMDYDIGAVGGLVLEPGASTLPTIADNKIDNLYLPNVQWYVWKGYKYVDHLYSSFLFRKGVTDHELSLSTVAHREETIFSHRIKRKGYKLKVTSKAITWHFRNPNGGIRSHKNQELWEHDEKIFQRIYGEWTNTIPKLVVLDNGMGDHVVFKKVLPDLKKKHSKVTIACCFPELFEGEDVISIADAKKLVNMDSYSLYKNMWDWNHTGTLEDAYRRLYL